MTSSWFWIDRRGLERRILWFSLILFLCVFVFALLSTAFSLLHVKEAPAFFSALLLSVSIGVFIHLRLLRNGYSTSALKKLLHIETFELGEEGRLPEWTYSKLAHRSIAKRGRMVWLVVVILFACWVMIRKFPISAGLAPDDQTILGNFIEWFGALFGIVMALVLVQVWSRHSQVNDELDKEADALTLLIKICRWLPDSSFKQRVAVNVKTYCEAMLKTQTRDAKNNQDAIVPLNQLHHDMGKILIDSSFPEPLIGELLRLINEVIDTRGDRLAHIKDRIPTPLWWLIFGTSMVWLFAFYTLQINNPRLATFVTGGSLFTVSALLFVIKDIDEHSGGFWRAQFEHFFVPLQEAQKLLNEVTSGTIGASDNGIETGR